MRDNRDPWVEAERRGVKIIEVPRRALKNRDGVTYGNTIYIAADLTGRELISVLWHELGHHARGDSCFPRALTPRIEAACDLYAAQALIDERELRRLASIYPDNPAKIAYELGVADWVLDAWVRAYPLATVEDCIAA